VGIQQRFVKIVTRRQINPGRLPGVMQMGRKPQ
jgi:hypothetical protein